MGSSAFALRPWLALVVAVLVPGVVHAQDAAQRWPGLATSGLSTVYVLDDAGAETAGRLIRLNPDSLVLLVDGVERRFEAARVRRIQKRGDPLRNGAVIGAVVGAVMGALTAGISDCPGDDPGGHCPGMRAGTFVLSIGAYAAMGAGIDAQIVGRSTLYTAPSPVGPRGSTALRPRPRPAVNLSFRW